MNLRRYRAADPDAPDCAFLWGVATSAYQSEGGYNGSGQPKTNWAKAESRREVSLSGKAAEFWTRYPEDFETCRELGLNAFRLGVEWSRVQPTCMDAPAEPPDFDLAALDHYADMLVACRQNGMEPVVTLHHFVHPAWLGADPWLDSATADHFTLYARTAARHINRALVRAKQRPVRYYLTINEPNMLVLNSYLGDQFPAGARRGIHTATRAYNHLLSAHVHAYNALHDLHESEGWESPWVTLNNYCSDFYWSDKLLFDLLSLRERKVSQDDARTYLLARAAAFEEALNEAGIPLRRDVSYHLGSLLKRIGNGLVRRILDMEAFRPFMECLQDSPRPRVFDYLALDYYDPFSAHVFRPPIWWDHEFRNKSLHAWVMNAVTSKWWDWRVLPRGLSFFCRHYSEDFGQRPVLVAENGMALPRRVDNRISHRRDRLTRSEFLRLHIDEVVHMRRSGIPLIGYLHWSLFDNYEWGTYTPRFGLFSLNYQQGTDRIPMDHYGDCPSRTYAFLIRQANHALMSPSHP